MVSSVGGNIDSQKWNPASKLAIGLSERRCSNQCLDDYIILNILFLSIYTYFRQIHKMAKNVFLEKYFHFFQNIRFTKGVPTDILIL